MKNRENRPEKKGKAVAFWGCLALAAVISSGNVKGTVYAAEAAVVEAIYDADETGSTADCSMEMEKVCRAVKDRMMGKGKAILPQGSIPEMGRELPFAEKTGLIPRKIDN